MGALSQALTILFDLISWLCIFELTLLISSFTVTTVWGLITMRLANDAILPLDYEKYASELQAYTFAIDIQLKSAKAPKEVSVESLLSAIKDLKFSVMCVMQELKVSLFLSMHRFVHWSPHPFPLLLIFLDLFDSVYPAFFLSHHFLHFSFSRTV